MRTATSTLAWPKVRLPVGACARRTWAETNAIVVVLVTGTFAQIIPMAVKVKHQSSDIYFINCLIIAVQLKPPFFLRM